MSEQNANDGPHIKRYDSRPGYAERKPKEVEADAVHDETGSDESDGVNGPQSDD